MLKAFHVRKLDACEKKEIVASLCSKKLAENSDDFQIRERGLRLKNSQVLANVNAELSHLDPEKQNEMSSLIKEYSNLFPEVPGRTRAIPRCGHWFCTIY